MKQNFDIKLRTMKQVLACMMLWLTGMVSAEKPFDASLRKKHFHLDKSGLALKGYDPVAYFTVKKAVKGSKNWSTFYDGVTYYFASEANRKTFKAAPSKYEPMYGGWCAYAMGNDGSKVDIDVETFKISGGKLYLFYNAFFNNTLNDWNKDENKLKAKADANWTKIFK